MANERINTLKGLIAQHAAAEQAAGSEEQMPASQALISGAGRAWSECLPDGITVEQVSSLADYRQDFAAATVALVGAALIEETKATHGDVDTAVSIITPDVDFDIQVSREQDDDGEPDCRVTASIQVRASDTFNSVVSEMADLW